MQITLRAAIAALIRFDRSPFRKWMAERSAKRQAERAAKAAKIGIVLVAASMLGGCATYDRANVWLYNLTHEPNVDQTK